MLRTATEVVVAVVLLAGFAALALRTIRRDRKRGAELAAFAQSHGLGYSHDDTAGLLDRPFRLLRKGASRGCRDVLWGQWRALPVRYADYWYLVPAAGEGGHSGGTGQARFSIVLAGLSIATPHLQVSKRDGPAGLAGLIGERDADLGSERFSREFRVNSQDHQFAVKLIDAGMVAWLLSAGTRFGFEMAGNCLLAYCPRLEPSELPSLFDAAAEFAAHIPRAVLDEYPARDVPQV